MALFLYLYVVLLISIERFCHVSGEDNIPTSTCYVSGRPVRCEPPRNSFSLDVVPLVNSTCGDSPTGFCFRHANLITQMFESDCTGICNASDPQHTHPPEHMTDFLLNEESWWQSENSINPEQTVIIDISLGTMVEVSVISFNFFSPLPRNFYILKSNDYGESYTSFHYFSSSCLNTYGIHPDQILNLNNETSILCQSIPYPAQGQITFFPAVGRPSSNDSIPGLSEELYNFITATNILIVLVEHFPIENLAADDFGYYYAIEDLSVIGNCQCHGHASSCLRDPLSGTYRCDCQHNTAGTFCERCADLYHDIPWQRANGNGYFECQACNCNNHSSLCVFNETIYELSDGVSGGVCSNCLHNTSGRHCEKCATYFYPQLDVPVDDPSVCMACNCHSAGTADDGDCAKDNSTDGVQVGDCFCKENVQGRTCSECTSGYFNLSLSNPQGCQACECNSSGSESIECDSLGVCDCKPNFIGIKCDLCQEGFFMADPNSVDGCIPCNCSLGGSLSALCDSTSGLCLCQPGLTGRTCSDIIPGYYFPSIDYLIYEAENAAGAQIVIREGNAYHQVTDKNSSITLGPLTPPTSGFYDVVMRYDLEGTLFSSRASVVVSECTEDLPIVCESPLDVLRVNYTFLPLGLGLSTSQEIFLRDGRAYYFELKNFDFGQRNSSAILRIDSLVLVFVNSSDIQEQLGTQVLLDYGHCASYFRSLSSINNSDPSCVQTIFLVSTAVFSGALRCNCSTDGTLSGQVCAPFGGQCPCVSNVEGLLCDTCTPGFHSLTTTGCRACNCDPNGSHSTVCDSNNGVCECLPNVFNQNCSQCADNFWGPFPNEGCRECSCNITGSMSLQCDIQTGVCHCKSGIEGSQCDFCESQHYRFSSSGCRSCMCSIFGSLSLLCNNVSGQCECKINAEGRDCSQCIQETFNLQESNPNGCQPCFCSGRSNNCTSASGYNALTIITKFNESTSHGWTTDNETDLPHHSSFGIAVEPNTSTYLRAPSIFLNNKLSSYSQYLTIAVNSSNVTIMTTMLAADVVLSSNGLSVGVNFSIPSFHAGLNIFRVHLHEVAGWTDLMSNLPIDGYSLQSILSSLDNLYITASYSEPVTIKFITLDSTKVASTREGDSEVSWVEYCSCPINYSGLSCELCADGYTRSSSGSCEPCQCNGFYCDPETGVCNCDNYTTGDSCELCQAGTYGNPLMQIPCQPCPCPLTTELGQFSTNCSFDDELNHPVCFDCPPGHTGLQCESCNSGYYGDPIGDFTGIPTMCSECHCNGNVDINSLETCNNVSGVCLQCLNNTSGDQCEFCTDGYYGDAINARNCSACDCNASGSNSSLCDSITGQCDCFPNVVGRTCGQCAAGYHGYGNISGCLLCGCHPEGAESYQCTDFGQCRCKTGVSGQKCDQCAIGYFGLSSQGCTECLCVASNSLSQLCDEIGNCNCNVGATGSDCSVCLSSYFQTGGGCKLCPECYQELWQNLDGIETSFDICLVQARQLRLLENDTIPFNKQLDIAREKSIQILRLVNDSFDIYHSSINQYENYRSSVYHTFITQVNQIEIDLSNLRRISTTVLVLASTSEELMNRTIFNFLLSQRILVEIQLTLVNVTELTNSIYSEYMIVTTIKQGIFEKRQALSSEATELVDLIIAILFNSTSAINTTHIVQTVVTTVKNQSYHLDMNFITVGSTMWSLQTEVEMLLSTTHLAELLQQQQMNLPNYISLQTGLRELISNASDIENHTFFDIKLEIDNQLKQFSSIDSTAYFSTANFNVLRGNLTILDNESSTVLLDLLILETIAQEHILHTLENISLSQELLSSLRNFSDDSQSIVNRTNQAATYSSGVKIKATRLEELADNVTVDIQFAHSDIQNARQITHNAWNTTRKLKQVVASIDLSIPSEIDGGNKVNIETNATHICALEDELVNISLRIDQAKVSGDKAAILSDSIEQGSLTAVHELGNLSIAIDALYIQPLNLTGLHLFLEELDQENDVLILYEEFKKMTSIQMSRRQTLEMSISSLKEKVIYLEYVNSLLPDNCI